ncbi:MAG: hypothetical protein IT306_07740 [Chloroflexi bacterium]|nr:hypothetical protein [Chloroflexota bacterium]
MPRDMSKVAGGGCILLFGLFFSTVSVFVVSVMWAVGAPWFFLLFTLPFLAVGFGMVGIGVWNLFLYRLLIARAFGPPSIELSASQVRLGDQLQVRFQQASRRDQEIGKVAIQLVFRESATYRRGRNTRTSETSTVIDQYETSGQQLARGELLTETCTLRVPRSGMHSFNTPDNALSWLVRITVQIPGTPDLDEETVVNVLPSVAADGGG